MCECALHSVIWACWINKQLHLTSHDANKYRFIPVGSPMYWFKDEVTRPRLSLSTQNFWKVISFGVFMYTVLVVLPIVSGSLVYASWPKSSHVWYKTGRGATSGNLSIAVDRERCLISTTFYFIIYISTQIKSRDWNKVLKYLLERWKVLI